MYCSDPQITRPRRHSDEMITGYDDASSGCHFVVATPDAHPELWRAYLDGARRSYRKHGVECVLEYDEVVDGRSTALFFAAVEVGGSVVGGMRVQGSYLDPSEAHALKEWDGRAGTGALTREIADRLPEGVIEMKTGWVADDSRNRDELTNALARIFVHSLRLMNVRYALGTVAEHAVPRWRTTGGVVSQDVTPAAYPSARYQTVPMWWDRQTFADLAAPQQLPFIMSESAQLPDMFECDRSTIAAVSW